VQKLPEQFHDFKWFAERFFFIRDRAGRTIPFKMNDLQLEFYKNMTGSDDVLKGRKGGVSTLIELMMLHKCLTRQNYRGVIMAHEYRSSLDVFGIASFAYQRLPDALRIPLVTDTTNKMVFRGLNSGMEAVTAKNLEVGRGGTIDFLHCSEIAFWDDAHKVLTAIGASMGAHPLVFRETTANGAGAYWHKQWLLGKKNRSGYHPHFFPWWVENSYRVFEPEFLKDPEEFTEEGIPKWEGDDPDAAFVPTEQEELLVARAGLDVPQLRWRRRAVTKFGNTFAQEYAEDGTTCFLTSGRGVFDGEMVKERYEQLMADPQIVVEDKDLGLTVHYQIDPDRALNASYVIGADVAEGLADEDDPTLPGDYCAAAVYERRSGIQVATVHGSWEPYEFAHILNKVCQVFTTPGAGLPLLGVERNEYGHAVLNELHHHIRYPKLHRHEVFDAVRQTWNKKLGWHTNTQTRPIMIQDFVKAVNEKTAKILDPDTYAECLTFVKNKRGRPEAAPGCHDDRVMANAIAWQMVQKYQGAAVMGADLY